MQARFFQLLHRLETMSLRERVMTLLGVPLVLLVAGEWLVFGPGPQPGCRSPQAGRSTRERCQGARLRVGLDASGGPAAACRSIAQAARRKAAADRRRGSHLGFRQPERRLGHRRARDRGRHTGSDADATQDVARRDGVFAIDDQAGTTAAPALAASVAKPVVTTAGIAAVPLRAGDVKSAGGENIYRHRAELTVTGNFSTLLGYLQTLQRLPGDLHWNSLQLDVAGYPQASVRLSLYTLSNRAETPFN
jgi:hypothetical protein